MREALGEEWVVTKTWSVRVGALLLVTAVTGLVAVRAAPDDGLAVGIWPVGLATGVLLIARRRRTLLLLGLILLVAVGTIWLGGRPFDVALGYGLGTTLESWVVWRLVTKGDAALPALRTDAHMARFVGATGAGALVIAGAGAATSIVTDWGRPGLVALALACAHLASQLTLLPFFTRLHEHPAVAPSLERVIQWVMIVTITPLVFLPLDFPSVVFMVIPLLGWAALRSSPWEALVQLIVVCGIAMVMTTYVRGPFASIPERYGLPVDARGIVLAIFVVDCALVVIPLMLTVGQQIENARLAAAERDKVTNIVNSATGVAIIGTDEIGRVTLFNPGAQRLLGYERDEVLGQFTTMFHSEQAIADAARDLGVRDDFVEVVLAMAAPESAGRDMKFRRKDGEERTHSMTLTRMVDERGEVTGYVSTSEDVTERVQAQEALVEALETERRAVERLRGVDQVKDAFVSSVSHELRTPITSIVGYLEMLEEGAFGELSRQQADAVRRVADNSARLLSLIDDLLTLSRVQEDGLAMADRAFDLRACVRAGYDVVVPAGSGRELAVHLALPDEPVPFVGDKDMVERVVVNLVGNAVKFSPDGGRVVVCLVVRGAEAVIEVSDTGIGIPIEEQDQLFSRFFRSTTAQKRAIPGSGLGLSIARAVVEKHGGSIAVDSAHGAGYDVPGAAPDRDLTPGPHRNIQDSTTVGTGDPRRWADARNHRDRPDRAGAPARAGAG